LYKHPRALTSDTPLGLLNKLIFEVILYFCRRGQENLHTLKVSDFEIKIGADRYKSVQKITSELDKIHFKCVKIFLTSPAEIQNYIKKSICSTNLMVCLV
jgi:hypothetical protein